MGLVLAVTLRIRNLTTTDLTSVSVYKAHHSVDFRKNDENFERASIPAGGCLEQALNPRNYMSTNTTNLRGAIIVQLNFKDGTVDIFKLDTTFNQSSATVEVREKHFQHFQKTHVVTSCNTRQNSNVFEITVKSSEAQLKNEAAERLNKEGIALMAEGKYQEASTKFEEASLKANRTETKSAIQMNRQKIQKKIDKKAKQLYNEGIQLLNGSQYKQALNKFYAALCLAKSEDTKGLIESGIKTTIERERKELNQEAKVILREAWTAETSSQNQANPPTEDLAKARSLLQQSNNIEPNPDCQDNIDLIDVQIKGDKCYNSAVRQENEGSSSFEETVIPSKPTRDKYKEIVKFYKDAKKKFERCLSITEQAINRNEKILEELDKINVADARSNAN